MLEDPLAQLVVDGITRPPEDNTATAPADAVATAVDPFGSETPPTGHPPLFPLAAYPVVPEGAWGDPLNSVPPPDWAGYRAATSPAAALRPEFEQTFDVDVTGAETLAPRAELAWEIGQNPLDVEPSGWMRLHSPAGYVRAGWLSPADALARLGPEYQQAFSVYARYPLTWLDHHSERAWNDLFASIIEGLERVPVQAVRNRPVPIGASTVGGAEAGSYTPWSNSIIVRSPMPSVTMHEVAHAIDFSNGPQGPYLVDDPEFQALVATDPTLTDPDSRWSPWRPFYGEDFARLIPHEVFATTAERLMDMTPFVWGDSTTDRYLDAVRRILGLNPADAPYATGSRAAAVEQGRRRFVQAQRRGGS